MNRIKTLLCLSTLLLASQLSGIFLIEGTCDHEPMIHEENHDPVWVAYERYDHSLPRNPTPEASAKSKKLFDELQQAVTQGDPNNLNNISEFFFKSVRGGREVFSAKLPLLFRAIEGGQLEVVNLLLDKGARIAATAKDGETPAANTITALMLAANKGNIAIVERVLKAVQEQHANIDQQDAYGRTALWIAAEKDNAQIVQLLLNAGANFAIQPNEAYKKTHPTPDLISKYRKAIGTQTTEFFKSAKEQRDAQIKHEKEQGIPEEQRSPEFDTNIVGLIGQYAGFEEPRAEQPEPSWMELSEGESDSAVDTSQDSSTSGATGSAAVGTTSPLAPAVRSASKVMDTSE